MKKLNFKNLNLGANELLQREQLKSVVGGGYNCVCNGHDIGTSDSAMGCAAKCYACVSNGGCANE